MCVHRFHWRIHIDHDDRILLPGLQTLIFVVDLGTVEWLLLPTNEVREAFFHRCLSVCPWGGGCKCL